MSMLYLKPATYIEENSGDDSLKKEFIIDEVCSYYHIKEEELRTKSRVQPLPEIRYVCMYFLREYTLLSLSKIGDIFERDHSTVIYSFKFINDLLDTDELFSIKFNAVRKNVLRRIKPLLDKKQREKIDMVRRSVEELSVEDVNFIRRLKKDYTPTSDIMRIANVDNRVIYKLTQNKELV